MTVTIGVQPVPADAAEGTERPAGPSLSPSRAADFKTCPLLFRFRTIDKLPERPSADQVRGTLVHAVLERLFDLPAGERTPEAAEALVAPEWARLVEQEPDLAALFAEPPVADDAGDAPMLAGMPADEAERLAAFLRGAGELLEGYFAVEDPRRLEPAERESLVSTLVDDELLIRGYIDRLDVSPAGDLRVVDYKTGGAPREAFEGRALFQLKFYALVLWRTRGVVPRVLRLLYLKDAEICDYSPDAEELERFERTLLALSQAIERAKRDRDFRPKPSRLCGWCSHQAFCPEFGGTPPPFPEPAGRPAADVTADGVAGPAGATAVAAGPAGVPDAVAGAVARPAGATAVDAGPAGVPDAVPDHTGSTAVAAGPAGVPEARDGGAAAVARSPGAEAARGGATAVAVERIGVAGAVGGEPAGVGDPASAGDRLG